VAAAEHGFTNAQFGYLTSALKLDADWTVVGGSRFAFECLGTIGYGGQAPVSSGARTFLVFYIIFGLGLVGLQLGKLAAVMRFAVQALWEFVLNILPWKFPGVQHDRRLLRLNDAALEACSNISKEKKAVSLDDLRQCIEAATHPRPEDLDELMEALSRNARWQAVLVSDVSISFARLHRGLLMWQRIRDFVGAAGSVLLFCSVSLPVFVVLEGWSFGDTAWFMYITITCIGLGDFAVQSGSATAYWFFFVLMTIGMEYLLVSATYVLLCDAGHRLFATVSQFFSRKAQPESNALRAEALAELGGLTSALPEEHTVTITSLLHFMRQSAGTPSPRL